MDMDGLSLTPSWNGTPDWRTPLATRIMVLMGEDQMGMLTNTTPQLSSRTTGTTTVATITQNLGKIHILTTIAIRRLPSQALDDYPPASA